ncbi:MAG: hypothetical protein JKY89_01015 [Immundisolibacteraceae bacterium]|nr:hypothetical protein [Immundisolibacteraceae bacterium]
MDESDIRVPVMGKVSSGSRLAGFVPIWPQRVAGLMSAMANLFVVVCKAPKRVSLAEQFGSSHQQRERYDENQRHIIDAWPGRGSNT